MECYLGIENVIKNDCIILRICIYSLVHATKQCNKKTIQILKKVGLTGGNVNPCLYLKNVPRLYCM